MAGWGDDPVLEELRDLLAAGWLPTSVVETRGRDTVALTRGAETRELASDHVAFHRYVEGLREDHPGLGGR